MTKFALGAYPVIPKVKDETGPYNIIQVSFYPILADPSVFSCFCTVKNFIFKKVYEEVSKDFEPEDKLFRSTPIKKKKNKNKGAYYGGQAWYERTGAKVHERLNKALKLHLNTSFKMIKISRKNKKGELVEFEKIKWNMSDCRVTAVSNYRMWAYSECEIGSLSGGYFDLKN